MEKTAAAVLLAIFIEDMLSMSRDTFLDQTSSELDFDCALRVTSRDGAFSYTTMVPLAAMRPGMSKTMAQRSLARVFLDDLQDLIGPGEGSESDSIA